MAWDWWRGRLMKQFVLAGATLVALEFTEALLYFWGPWQQVTSSWVHAWARLAG